MTRRDLAFLAPALAAAQTAKPPKPNLTSQTYLYDTLPVKESANGNRGRAILDGLTHTGYPVELHMTQLAPGEAPHAPHRAVNEEILMLRPGSLGVTIEGKTTRLASGSVT